MDDLAAMRKASQKTVRYECAACELEQRMTPEHLGLFRDSYTDNTVNTTGQMWLITMHYPDCRLLTLNAPEQCVRRHVKHLDRG